MHCVIIILIYGPTKEYVKLLVGIVHVNEFIIKLRKSFNLEINYHITLFEITTRDIPDLVSRPYITDLY